MGYYVQIADSTAFIPKQNLEKAYEVMCELNTTHDSQKRGGSWSGGKQNEKWFSWMDSNYPETCKDAQAILEQLGFETFYNDNGDLIIDYYDNKTGQEDLFMESISKLATGSIKWKGEDGAKWTTKFTGKKVVDTKSDI